MQSLLHADSDRAYMLLYIVSALQAKSHRLHLFTSHVRITSSYAGVYRVRTVPYAECALLPHLP